MSHGEDNLIAWLGQASGGAEVLGGKGASLDRLGKLGFRVPPGFCLTTTAFRAQLAAGALPAELANAALAAPVEGALSASLTLLVAELTEAHGTEPRFAVRSSAVGEDGSAASYAGLHETELDVTPDGVAGAVRRCWASLWSPSAVAYRQRRNLPDAGAEMAVVIQSLVPADVSAVVFTRHPVTDRDDQVVLTAVRGLGDEMVAGTITPDTYVIDKATGSVLSFDPGEDPAGPALDRDALAALIALSVDVEARFGAAVDIEAAMARGTWYLLQARPITTGAPAPAAR